MPEYMRLDKQLLVAAIGAATSIITGVTLGLIEVRVGYSLYSFTLFSVIPLGAIIAGFVAATGYYFGAKLFHQKPAGGVFANMVCASLSVFLVAHYMPYFALEVDGIRIKEIISFWQYLDLDIRTASISFMNGNYSTGVLGGWGYVFSGLHLLGFSVGGMCVYCWLLQNPYCDKCSRYFKHNGTQERFTSDGITLAKQTEFFTSFLDYQRYIEAISFHAKYMGVKNGSSHDLRTKIITSVCTSCNVNHLELITSKLNGDNWDDISGGGISLFTGEQLEIVF
jgi:hypothetical protein